MSLRILLCHPGADIATHDVWLGLRSGLLAEGHQIYDYALDERIGVAAQWLEFSWRKAKKAVEQANAKTIPEAHRQVPTRPTQADTLYKAGAELVERALRLQPDVVLIVSAMFLHPDAVVLLKRAGLKVAILFTESPYDDEKQTRLLPFCDVAWTNERISAKGRVGYLPHARNADVHTALGEASTVAAHDVVFVGTFFEERVEFLSAVDWTGIDLGLYGGTSTLGSRSVLRPFVKGGYLPNSQTIALYRKATIGLNLYRQSKGFGKGAPRIAHAESLNPRAYELAATSCFSISQARAEVSEVFGDLVPTFETPQELRALLDRWLPDQFGRALVTSQLPFAVSGHTWQARAQHVTRDLLGAGIGARREAITDPPLARVVGG